jgi:hypothetical protein
LRLVPDGAGDRDALLHPAGELEGMGVASAMTRSWRARKIGPRHQAGLSVDTAREPPNSADKASAARTTARLARARASGSAGRARER